MEVLRIGAAMILKEFHILKKYDPYFISNCKFYEFDAEYLFEHITLKEEFKVLRAEQNGFY